MSGAHGGTYFSGSSTHVGPLGSAPSSYAPAITTPVTAFTTVTDITTSIVTGDGVGLLSDGNMGGEMIRYGRFQPIVEEAMLCFMYRGAWSPVDESDGAFAQGMLGIATCDDGAADEGLVLLRGIARIPVAHVENGGSLRSGYPIYLSATQGHYSPIPSTTSGDIIRVVGYCIDFDGSDNLLIYFCPDNSWVEIA